MSSDDLQLTSMPVARSRLVRKCASAANPERHRQACRSAPAGFVSLDVPPASKPMLERISVHAVTCAFYLYLVNLA